MHLKFDKFDFIIDKQCVQNSLLIVISGSHAYGWESYHSDLDIRRVFFPDINQALSVFYRCRTKQFTQGDIDITEYPIQDFIRLLAKGNGNALDNLFEVNGPPFPHPTFPYDKTKTSELQSIVLEHLHKGFLMHCTGYDTHIVKDMENKTRLERYGEHKLLLNRYKILLEGLILAKYNKVVYNLLKQQDYIKTEHCLSLREEYLALSETQASGYDLHSLCDAAIIEADELHSQLVNETENSGWSTAHQNTLDIALEHWLIDQYLPKSP